MVIFHIVFSYVYQMEKPSGKHGLLKNPTIYTSISFPDRRFPTKKGTDLADVCTMLSFCGWNHTSGFKWTSQPQKWDTSKSSAWRTSAISLGTGRHLQPAGLHFVTRQMQIQNHGFVSNIWANYIDSLLRKRWKKPVLGVFPLMWKPNATKLLFEDGCYTTHLWYISHRGWFMASALPHNIQHLIISN
jgi:hypothetical protein